jgi:GNAT superfamily N-acetyltransferase
MSALEIRPAEVSTERLADYASLLNATFGGNKFNMNALAWRYRDNPMGRIVGVDAWDGDRLAAHYITCPMQAKIEGRVVRGLLSMNTATHPDYQGQGLFTRLAATAYDLGKSAGYEFVIGVANANSTPGFLRKLQFQHVAPLLAGVLPLTPARLSAYPVQFEGYWTDEALSWRLANPDGDYGASRRGSVRGVWSKTHLPFVRCGAFLPDRAIDLPRAPFGASLFIGLEPRLDLSRLLSIPERFRPSPLNLIWRPLSDGVPVQLAKDAVALNFLDFDPY